MRPDYSEFVGHFTRAVAISNNPALNAVIGEMSPLQRLSNILLEKRIRATRMPYSLGGEAAAFTECPWTSLLHHAQRYSPYAVGFEKQLLWEKGGQPAVYLRSAYLHEIKNHVEQHAGHAVYPAIANGFGALYTPIEREAGWPMLNGATVQTHVDFSHEREWRVVGDFTFDYADIKFVVVDRFSDVASLPPAAVQSIGEDRFLSMSNYRRITQLWPT